MKKTIWYLILIGLAIGIGMLVGKYLFDKNNGNTQYWEEPGFKPDTIREEVYYKPILPKNSQAIVPKVVIDYEKLAGYIKPKIEYRDSIIYVETETGQYQINDRYIGFHPEAPKLIFGTFTDQALSFDLLDTGGNLQTLIFPVDYSQYDYRWDGQGISVSKTKSNAIPHISGWKRNFKTNSNLYLGYEPFTKIPLIQADYSASFKRVGLYGQGAIGYNMPMQNLDWRLHGGLRITLK